MQHGYPIHIIESQGERDRIPDDFILCFFRTAFHPCTIVTKYPDTATEGLLQVNFYQAGKRYQHLIPGDAVLRFHWNRGLDQFWFSFALELADQTLQIFFQESLAQRALEEPGI